MILIVIATAAFLLPLLADRLRVPAVVLEILFGVVVGPSLLRLIESSAVLDFLAEFGFLLLMFLSGFEIDFGKLERQGPLQRSIGLVIFLLTLALSYAASRALDRGVFITLLLATTSVGLVVPTLRSTRRASTALGQIILISALLADLLTLMGVTVFALVQKHGVSWKLLNLPILFLAIAAVLLLLRRATWWNPEWFERLFMSHDPEEVGIRACLALMFGIVGLSYVLDVEPILGAFLAGMVFGLVFRNRGTLEEQLKGFSYGFLIPIFFIDVGIKFDLRALLEPGVLTRALALIGAAVLVKVLPALVMLVLRLSPREVLAAGVLLSARLSLVIAVADLGRRLGLLDQGLNAAVILLAVFTATVMPALFRLLAPALPPRPAPLPSPGAEVAITR
jgi:Kef-type K+ transport system membrane component KefB